MNIFVAGASGAIGQPLIRELIRHGHTVTGMTHSEVGAQSLIDLGATVAFADTLDCPAVEEALRRFHTEVIIDELTALPKDPADYPGAFEGDRRLRLEGGGNLLRATQACGVRRYIQQASGFFLKGGGGLADESASLAIDASPGVAASAHSYAHLETRLLHSSGNVEGVVMRYGFFYGPNTLYSPEGAAANHVRRRETPIVGRGDAVWSFIHIDDAALATVAAMTIPPGVYNIVDDDPSPVSRWLPAFARWVGAPPPPQLSEQQVRETAGEEAVYYGTKLSGASNHKAKDTFEFRPRRLQWLAL
jgi:2-alkyl-3-oxoalkanoate reductase